MSPRCRHEPLSAEMGELSERLGRLERRLDDTEDDVWAALAPDRLDDLWMRVDDLAAGAVTHEELMELRLHVSRVATELARVTAELRGALEPAAPENANGTTATGERATAVGPRSR